MQRVAAAGRLRISEERAVHLFHAAACGIVMTLLGMNVEDRDLSLSEAACGMALATIVTGRHIAVAPTARITATALRALLTSAKEAVSSGPQHFTEAEHGLLVEWLERLSEVLVMNNGKSHRVSNGPIAPPRSPSGPTRSPHRGRQ